VVFVGVFGGGAAVIGGVTPRRAIFSQTKRHDVGGMLSQLRKSKLLEYQSHYISITLPRLPKIWS